MAIEPDKLELLRVALPRGLAAGDSGLGELRGKSFPQQPSWPQFQSTQTNSRLYTPSPESTEIPITQQSQQASTLLHPWKIYLRTQNNDTQFKVDLNSVIYPSFQNWDTITVVGLDTWSDVSTGFVVISGDVNNLECELVSISGPIVSPPDRISFSEDTQASFSVIIGYLYQQDGTWCAIQNAFQNLTLIDVCVDGKAAIYPIPS